MYETLKVIAGIFFIFTTVKMKEPNKSLNLKISFHPFQLYHHCELTILQKADVMTESLKNDLNWAL